MKKNDVVVIGGGVIGLMSAYMLHKSGKTVVVIDKSSITDNASFGNAGLLSAFEKHPLSTPGIILSTAKLIPQGKSPMLLNPTLDPKIYKWLWNFMKNSTPNRVKRTMALFEKYGETSIELYQEIMEENNLDFDFHRDGLLMIYTSQKSFKEKIKNIQNDKMHQVYTANETKEHIPFINNKINGSVLLKRNGHLDPAVMMNSIKKYLIENGVKFILEEEIVDFVSDDKKIIEAKGKSGTSYTADEFILSTGHETFLAKKMGTELNLIPAKGYSITFEIAQDLKPKIPSLFNDLFIACTPRKNSVRLTSKLELGSNNPMVIKSRIESILKNLKEYTVDFEIKNPVHWAGFRPLPPNDIPLIGRDDKYSNLVHATGLGWLGITFGPAIGKIISDLIIEDIPNKKSDDILLFSSFYQ